MGLHLTGINVHGAKKIILHKNEAGGIKWTTLIVIDSEKEEHEIATVYDLHDVEIIVGSRT